MDSINLKEARSRLSDLVSAAEHGETTVITRRGKRVACIGPVKPKRRRGLPDLSAFRASIKVKGKPLSQIVIEERRRARY